MLWQQRSASPESTVTWGYCPPCFSGLPSRPTVNLVQKQPLKRRICLQYRKCKVLETPSATSVLLLCFRQGTENKVIRQVSFHVHALPSQGLGYNCIPLSEATAPGGSSSPRAVAHPHQELHALLWPLQDWGSLLALIPGVAPSLDDPHLGYSTF